MSARRATTMTAEAVRKLAGGISVRTLMRLRAAGLRPSSRGRYGRAAVEAFLTARQTLDERQRTAQTRLAAGLADEGETRLARLRAEHVSTEQARREWAAARTAVSARLAQLPDELAPIVMAHADRGTTGELAAALQEPIRAFLRAVAGLRLAEDLGLADLGRGRDHGEVDQPSGGDRRQETLEDARARWASVKGALAELRAHVATAAVLRRDEVVRILRGPAIVVRQRLLNLPPKWAPQLHAAAREGGAPAVQQLLHQAIAEVGAELTEDPLSLGWGRPASAHVPHHHRPDAPRRAPRRKEVVPCSPGSSASSPASTGGRGQRAARAAAPSPARRARTRASRASSGKSWRRSTR